MPSRLRPLFPERKLLLRPLITKLEPVLAQSKVGRILLEGLKNELEDCLSYIQRKSHKGKGPPPSPGLVASTLPSTLITTRKPKPRHGKPKKKKDTADRPRDSGVDMNASDVPNEAAMSGANGPRGDPAPAEHSDQDDNDANEESTPGDSTSRADRNPHTPNETQANDKRRRRRRHSTPLPPVPKFSFKKGFLPYLNECIKYEVAAKEKEARRKARIERREAKPMPTTIPKKNPINFGADNSEPRYPSNPHSRAVEERERRQERRVDRLMPPAIASTDNVSAAWEEGLMPRRKPQSDAEWESSSSETSSTDHGEDSTTPPTEPTRPPLSRSSTHATLSPRPPNRRTGSGRPRSSPNELNMPTSPGIPRSSVAGRTMFPSMQQHAPPLPPSTPLSLSHGRVPVSRTGSQNQTGQLPAPIPTYLDRATGNVSGTTDSRRGQAQAQNLRGDQSAAPHAVPLPSSGSRTDSDGSSSNDNRNGGRGGLLAMAGFDGPGWGWGNHGAEEPAAPDDSGSEGSTITSSSVEEARARLRGGRKRGTEGRMEEGRRGR